MRWVEGNAGNNSLFENHSPEIQQNISLWLKAEQWRWFESGYEQVIKIVHFYYGETFENHFAVRASVFNIENQC